MSALVGCRRGRLRRCKDGSSRRSRSLARVRSAPSATGDQRIYGRITRCGEGRSVRVALRPGLAGRRRDREYRPGGGSPASSAEPSACPRSQTTTTSSTRVTGCSSSRSLPAFAAPSSRRVARTDSSERTITATQLAQLVDDKGPSGSSSRCRPASGSSSIRIPSARSPSNTTRSPARTTRSYLQYWLGGETPSQV